jgi:type I restriction enzyme M protein
MIGTNQKQMGNTLFADQLRGAMNADDFRDDMLSFFFLGYFCDNYQTVERHTIIQPFFPSSSEVEA